MCTVHSSEDSVISCYYIYTYNIQVHITFRNNQLVNRTYSKYIFCLCHKILHLHFSESKLGKLFISSNMHWIKYENIRPIQKKTRRLIMNILYIMTQSTPLKKKKHANIIKYKIHAILYFLGLF